MCANGRCRGPDPQALNLRASIAEREAALIRQLGHGGAADSAHIDQEIETRMARTRQVKQALIARAGLSDHVSASARLDRARKLPLQFATCRSIRVMMAFSSRIFCLQRQVLTIRVFVEAKKSYMKALAYKHTQHVYFQDQSNHLINQINNGPTQIPQPGGRAKRSAVFMEENFSKQWPFGKPIPFKFDPQLSERRFFSLYFVLYDIYINGCRREGERPNSSRPARNRWQNLCQISRDNKSKRQLHVSFGARLQS